MQVFTTYILHSKALGTFYIGYTADSIDSRLKKHLALHKGYTAKAKDWVVCYTEEFATKSEAMRREKELKGWKSKLRIQQLIQRNSTE